MRTILVPHLPMRVDAKTKLISPTISLRPVRNYGRFKVAYAGTRWTAQEVPNLKKAIDEMDEDDCVMCVGDVAALSAAIHYMHAKHGKVNLLRWARDERTYYQEEMKL